MVLNIFLLIALVIIFGGWIIAASSNRRAWKRVDADLTLSGLHDLIYSYDLLLKKPEPKKKIEPPETMRPSMWDKFKNFAKHVCDENNISISLFSFEEVPDE